MRAFRAAVLASVALAGGADANGLLLPPTSGYGSPPAAYNGPVKAQLPVAAAACDTIAISSPTAGNTIWAVCGQADPGGGVSVNTPTWTAYSTYGYGTAKNVLIACRVVQAGDTGSLHPFVFTGSPVFAGAAVEVANSSGGCPGSPSDARTTGVGTLISSLSVSLTASHSTLFLAFCTNLDISTSPNVASIPGLNGADFQSAKTAGGTVAAIGVETGTLVASGLIATCNAATSSSGGGMSLDVLGIQ